MGTQQFLTDARSIVTLVSFLTFVGILWWTYISKGVADFDAAAMLPFADDEPIVPVQPAGETGHG